MFKIHCKLQGSKELLVNCKEFIEIGSLYLIYLSKIFFLVFFFLCVC